MEKNNKILIMSLVVFVVLTLLLGGFIVIDKTLLDNANNNVQSTNNVDPDELYKEHLKNLKENIKSNYGAHDEYLLYNSLEGTNDYYGLNYNIKINENFELLVSYSDKYRDYKISDNVAYFFSVYEGNGGFRKLYYVTFDGVLYSVDIEYSLFSDKTFDIKTINRKNIISVIEGEQDYELTGGSSTPIFIDIQGNMYVGESD